MYRYRTCEGNEWEYGLMTIVHRFKVPKDSSKQTTYWSFLFTHFSFEKKKPPVCVAYNTIIMVKHTLIECADLVEIRKKYFEERCLYSLFWNVNPGKILTTWKRLVCFTKYKVFWSKFCVEKYFNCDIEGLRFCRNMCDVVCVYVWNNCAVEILWLMLNDLCSEY